MTALTVQETARKPTRLQDHALAGTSGNRIIGDLKVYGIKASEFVKLSVWARLQ